MIFIYSVYVCAGQREFRGQLTGVGLLLRGFCGLDLGTQVERQAAFVC